MGTSTFSDDFKRDAVAQITERGYPVSEVSERLGVSKHSLYAWKRKFAKTASGETEKDAEIRRLKRELARVSEERDILKRGEPWRTRISPGMQSEWSHGAPLVRAQWRRRLWPSIEDSFPSGPCAGACASSRAGSTLG